MEQQALRITSLVEDFHPVLRRRAFTSIRTSFPAFYNPDPEPSLISMNESQRLISQSFAKINNIIDLVDDHICRRIQCYEKQVVSVVQNQIEQMREQTHKVVAQFNSMIQQKNKENEIWSLNNQLDYFKSEAKKLFDSNRKLRKQNAQMLKKFKQYEWELENRQVIMQKLWYKYQKEKHHKGKLKTMMDEGLLNIEKSASPKRKDSKLQIMQFSLKNDTFNFEEMMPQIKLNSIKPSKILNQIRKSGIINQKQQDESDKANLNIQNSLLHIDCEDESMQSRLSIKGKSLSIQQIKPETKDQQLQVNIFLSEHSYKNLFEKKTSNKKLLKSAKPSQQIAIQTDNPQNGFNGLKRQNQSVLTSPKKNKGIDFGRNGFYINDIQNPNSKTSYYRSTSTNNHTTKRDTFYNSNLNDHLKGRVITETGFNKSPKENDVMNVLSHKSKFQNKIYFKMAKRLERSKIVDRAYDKLNKSIEH